TILHARVARYGVEAPCLGTSLGVVCRDIAAGRIFGTAVADHYFALEDPRGPGDRVFLAAIDSIDRPALLTGLGIKGDQPTIVGAEIDLTIVERESATDHVTAAVRSPSARNLGVVAPQDLTARAV